MLDEREAVDNILYKLKINGIFAGKWASSLIILESLLLKLGLKKVRIIMSTELYGSRGTYIICQRLHMCNHFESNLEFILELAPKSEIEF